MAENGKTVGCNASDRLIVREVLQRFGGPEFQQIDADAHRFAAVRILVEDRAPVSGNAHGQGFAGCFPGGQNRGCNAGKRDHRAKQRGRDPL